MSDYFWMFCFFVGCAVVILGGIALVVTMGFATLQCAGLL